MSEENNDQIEEQTTEAEVETPQQTQADQDHNWKQARQVMGAQAKEINELKEALAAMRERKAEVEEQYDPDDYATYTGVEKKVTKYTKDLQGKIEQLEKKLHQTEQEKLESTMRTRYDDYDYVIEKFAIPMIEKDQSLAASLKASSNPYKLAYRLAKSSDEYEAAQSKKSSKLAEKAEKNASRPLSANADGGSLKDKALQFTNMSAADIWKMSQSYARNA